MRKRLNSSSAQKSEDLVIVGIGASAGGLESSTSLLRCLPVDTGMAFVLIQHLDPKHESQMPELLARATTMSVEEARNGVRVEPNHVYVNPPSSNVTIVRGRFKLLPRPRSKKLNFAIDLFFRSLAEDQKKKAITVILSGSGSDGTLGSKAIQSKGGTTLSLDPKIAMHDGMARSSISNGYIDHVLSIEGIARELTRVAQGPLNAPGRDVPSDKKLSADENLSRIFLLLKKHTHVDFTQYKVTTIKRRIQRQLMLLKIDSTGKYADYLSKNEGALDALCEDIFIHVTEFFRDPDSFQAVTRQILQRQVKNRPNSDPIRIWIPGCSTGEEAFSLAISLYEALEHQESRLSFQIFATDISEHAVKKARAGFYPESQFAHVSKERIRRFFEPVKDGYRVKKIIRDSCIFARHDVTSNPPFAKLDLISCRNVLIYFSSALQNRLVPIFHYALKPGGLLWLGRSEIPSSFSKLFTLIDKTNKIFTKINTASTINFNFPANPGILGRSNSTKGGTRELDVHSDFQSQADQIVLSKFSPVGVVVNSDMEILQFRGRTVPFLEPVSGQPSYNLLKMVRPELLPGLRMTLQTAKKLNIPVRSASLSFKIPGRKIRLYIDVVSINPHAAPKERHYLVLFEDLAKASKGQGKGPTRVTALKRSHAPKGADVRDQIIAELNGELDEIKQYQQSLSEEYESAQEELTSANEELQSSNEELQSTNEELETAKEELQATNEELTTLNDELESRNLELERESALVQLFEAVTVAANEATSVNEALKMFLERTCAHAGWSIGHAFVLSGQDVLVSKGIWYQADKRKHLALQNVTETMELSTHSPFIEQMRASHSPVLIAQLAEEKHYPRAAVAHSAGLVSAFAFPIFINQSVVAVLEYFSTTAIEPNDRFLEVMSHMSSQLGRVLERKKWEESLQRTQSTLRAALESRDDFLSIASHELKTPITALKLHLQLALKNTTIEMPQKLLRSAVEQTDRLTRLIEDLLDVTKIQAGKLRPNFENMNLSQLIHEIASRFSNELETAHCRINLRLDDSIVGYWDHQRIEQVIINLLSNSIKYAPGGEVVISTSLDGSSAFMVIQDFGPGIPKEKQGQIFDRFERATSSRKISGLGLGLFIVKEIVQAHRGQICLESEPGMGAKFIVRLPLVPSSQRGALI